MNAQIERTGETDSSREISPAGRWLALTAALLGWMFDGAEMGLFSMVGRPAIQDLLGFAAAPSREQEDQTRFLFGVVIAMFLVGAATGGVLFGWLGDRIGRVRAMSLSVLTYALFTGLCGIVTTPLQIAALRFIAALGMGGEWSLGVALVMEVWPNRSRALMAGLIGAAANVGYMLVGVVGLMLSAILGNLGGWLLGWGLPSELVDRLLANQGWRVLMILGATPALLTFFFRLFVPESERWKQQHGRGATSHWQTRDLAGVLVGALGPALIVYVWSIRAWPAHWGTTHIVLARVSATILGLLVATAGYTFPVARYLRRHALSGTAQAGARPIIGRMLLAAGLSGVALLGTWGSTQWAAAWANQLTGGQFNSKEFTQIWLAVGACVGTIGAALLGDWLGRRATYVALCAMSLISALYLFLGNDAYGTRFLVSCFAAGVCTASFYGWLPLYLPELFSTSVRATGQGFGFNFGRIIAAVGALQTGILFQGNYVFELWGWSISGGYPLACSAMSLIYLLGPLLISLAPETRGRPLPD
jgi:MFS family permease